MSPSVDFLVFALISFVVGLAFMLRGRAIRREGLADVSVLPVARVGRRAEPIYKQTRTEGAFWIFVGLVFMIGGTGLFGFMYLLSIVLTGQWWKF